MTAKSEGAAKVGVVETTMEPTPPSRVRITDDDIWIAQEARNIKIPFYMVRTKFDLDVANDKEDNENHDEQKLLEDVRQKISIDLKKCELETNNIFLVSTRPKYSALWDYPSFTDELINNTPVKKSRSSHSGSACFI